jgi:large subunit ribosomal protein L10
VQRSDKERIVDELAAELGAADTLIVADYRGLTNKQLEKLRDELLPHRARFRIVKNTLTRRAAELSGADPLLVMLEGPTAIAFIDSGGDPATVAKALAATARETNVLTLRGGVLEGKTLSREDVEALAKLPPVDVLRGQLVGAIASPLTILARGLGSMISGLAVALGQVREKRDVEIVRAETQEAAAAGRRLGTGSNDEHDDGSENGHPANKKEAE